MCRRLGITVFLTGLGSLALAVVLTALLVGARPAAAVQSAAPCQPLPPPAPTVAAAPALPRQAAAVAPARQRLPATGNAGILPEIHVPLFHQTQPCPDATASPASSPTPTSTPNATATATISVPNVPGGGGINIPPGGINY